MQANEVMELVLRLRALTGWTSTEAVDKCEADVESAIRAICDENERLRRELGDARKLMQSVVKHARRYHQCDDGPFDMGDKFASGEPWKELEPDV